MAHKRSYFFIVLAIFLLALIVLMPIPESLQELGGAVLTQQGKSSLAVLMFCLVLWLSEALPFHITGMLAVVLLTVLKVDTFKEIISLGFGNDTIVFFIGVLVLAAFISKSGMGERISMFVLSKTGNSTSKILLGFLIVGSMLAMWITGIAAAAMLYPLGVSILKRENVQPMQSNFGKALLIGCAWGPAIGGIATPAGSAANPIAITLLSEIAGIDVTFTQWMIYGVPCTLMLILPAWFILRWVFPFETKTLSFDKQQLKKEYDLLPKMGRNEKTTAVVFILTIVLLVGSPIFELLLGISIPTAMPAFFTICLFFLPGASTLSWKEIQKDVGWNSIILVATGISLGMMLFQTGAAEWLSQLIFGRMPDMPLLLEIMVMILLTSFVKMIFSSNAVTATVMLPIVILLAMQNGGSALQLTLPVAISICVCLMMVTSSPTNVLPYSAGYFSIRDFTKAGLPITIVASVVIALVVYGVGLITGLY